MELLVIKDDRICRELGASRFNLRSYFRVQNPRAMVAIEPIVPVSVVSS